MRLAMKICLYMLSILLLVNTVYIITAKDIVSYVVYEPQTILEEYTELVPYMDTQEYLDQVPMPSRDCRNEPFPYEVVEWKGEYECVESAGCAKFDLVCTSTAPNGACTNYEKVCAQQACSAKKTVCTLTIRNAHKAEGLFAIGAYFVVDEERTDAAPLTKIVKAGARESWEFVHERSAQPQSVFCDYRIVKLPEYETCELHDVMKTVKKYRNVLKYEEVKKTREVVVQQPVERKKAVSKYFGE